jgi:hypothetical protein
LLGTIPKGTGAGHGRAGRVLGEPLVHAPRLGRAHHRGRAIDQTIGNVIGAPFVALRGEGGTRSGIRTAVARAGRHEAGPDHAQVMELCRRLAGREEVRLPSGTEALVGRPWFD